MLIYIDERMVDIFIKEEGVGWFVDYVVFICDVFIFFFNVKRIEFCRIYIYNESLIFYFGNELDLDVLMEECIIVL